MTVTTSTFIASKIVFFNNEIGTLEGDLLLPVLVGILSGIVFTIASVAIVVVVVKKINAKKREVGYLLSFDSLEAY